VGMGKTEAEAYPGERDATHSACKASHS